MVSFFLAPSIKSTCRRLLLPLGLLAVCNSTAMAVGNGKLNPTIKLNSFFAAISGTVTDEKGQALPGVSVYDKQSKKSTTTDGDGKFMLDVSNGTTLVFSYIGYETQEISVASGKTINIRLKESSNTLNEVVAIGYQKIRKSDVTGAISSVKASEMNLSAPTVGQALVGKVAGVQVSQTSGAPYAGTKIRVRGVGSINASSNPLYVIDGYPSGNNVFINPEDIETIDILKDAASAAIYGSRASGGVVMITTKRGKDGKGRFQYDVQAGVTQLHKKVKLLDASQFIQLMIDGRNNAYKDLVVNGGRLTWNDSMFSDNNTTRTTNVGNGSSVSIPEDIYDFASQTAKAPAFNTDWQDELYQNAFFQRHNLAFSGGNKDIKYFVSGGYQDQDGIVTNTAMRALNFRSNIEGQVSKKLKVGANISLTQTNNKEVGEGRFSPMMSALLYLPYLPANDANGNPMKYGMSALANQFGYQGLENPVATVTEMKVNRLGNRNTYNAYANYEILSGLNFKANLGTNNYSEKYDYYRPTSLSNGGGNAPGSPSSIAAANAVARNLTQVDKLAEFTLDYAKSFGKHNLDVLAGYSAQHTTSDLVRVTATGFTSDKIGEISDKGAANTDFVLNEANKSVTTLLSYFGRASYNFDSKYYLSGTFRMDGSSRFGPNNKWGAFASAAAGWNLSQESWYNDFLGRGSSVKLRASWGLSGNNNIGDYNHTQTMSSPGGVVFGPGNAIATAVWAGGIKDQNLGWESTSQYNFGTDLSFFNGRLSLIANYYYSLSYNLLFNQPISAISGSSTILTNLRDSKVRNKGFDFQLDGRVVSTDNFNLGLSGNISFNSNKVLNLGGNSTIFSVGAERQYITHVTQEGQSIGMFYGYQVAGRVTPELLGKVAPSSAQSNPYKVGDLYFEDTNGDGVVNDADKKVIGNPYPDFTYGFAVNANFKSFDIRASFNGSQGNDVLDGQDYYLYNFEGSGNQYVEVADRYRNAANPGSGLNYRASRAGTQSNSTRLSSFYVQDGSYLRCTNITLGYNFPKSAAKTLHVENIRIFGSVDNAFTITDYKGYNPEVDYNAGANLTLGVDYGNYPLARAYNLGIKLTF